jgi:hypothetical protein
VGCSAETPPTPLAADDLVDAIARAVAKKDLRDADAGPHARIRRGLMRPALLRSHPQSSAALAVEIVLAEDILCLAGQAGPAQEVADSHAH